MVCSGGSFRSEQIDPWNDMFWAYDLTQVAG